MSGVEQGLGAVVRPVRDPERDSPHAFYKLVDGLGPPVREPSPVTRRTLGAPAGDRVSEALYLGRAGVVLEIDAELGHELVSEAGIVDLVDRADDLFGVPGHADLTVGVAGFE